MPTADGVRGEALALAAMAASAADLLESVLHEAALPGDVLLKMLPGLRRCAAELEAMLAEAERPVLRANATVFRPPRGPGRKTAAAARLVAPRPALPLTVPAAIPAARALLYSPRASASATSGASRLRRRTR